jgi:hypothetical protein
MSVILASLNPGRYFLWCTGTDSACSQEMSREEAMSWLLKQHSCVEEDLARIQAERSLERCDDHGTSYADPEDTAERLVKFNRMGPRGGIITTETLRKRLAKGKI